MHYYKKKDGQIFGPHTLYDMIHFVLSGQASLKDDLCHPVGDTFEESNKLVSTLFPIDMLEFLERRRYCPDDPDLNSGKPMQIRFRPMNRGERLQIKKKNDPGMNFGWGLVFVGACICIFPLAAVIGIPMVIFGLMSVSDAFSSKAFKPQGCGPEFVSYLTGRCPHCGERIKIKLEPVVSNSLIKCPHLDCQEDMVLFIRTPRVEKASFEYWTNYEDIMDKIPWKYFATIREDDDKEKFVS